jgi:hypothetical protein
VTWKHSLTSAVLNDRKHFVVNEVAYCLADEFLFFREQFVKVVVVRMLESHEFCR